MRVVFVENEDSFSWNVIDQLPCTRAELTILSGREAARALPEAEVLVIGPGPTDPVRAGLLGVVQEAARRRLPTLGICLGHQAIGLAFGARLIRARPMHGKQSPVVFEASRCFPAVRGALTVMRYHSLALAEVPSPLRIIAATEDGLPMAIEHDTLPLAGLQFHPDSFATPRGAELVESFFASALGGRS